VEHAPEMPGGGGLVWLPARVIVRLEACLVVGNCFILKVPEEG